jgi:hypothetical protein
MKSLFEASPRNGREMVEFWGAHAQFVRLMAWISCGEPDVRKRLLAAWLVERGEAPSGELLEAAIRRLAVSHTDADVTARIQEAREILKQYRSMKKGFLGLKLAHVSGEKIGLNRETGMQDLDYLIRATPTDRFLGVGLFYMRPEQRRAIYEGIPMAPRLDAVMPRVYAWAGYPLYVLLWRYEPDASIRREVLVPRMEKLGYPTLDGVFASPSAKGTTFGGVLLPVWVWAARGDPVYWDLIAGSQRKPRREEVKALQDKLVRLGDEQGAKLEQKLLGILAQRASEEASSTSPTLTRFPRPTGMPKGADGASARNE